VSSVNRSASEHQADSGQLNRAGLAAPKPLAKAAI